MSISASALICKAKRRDAETADTGNKILASCCFILLPPLGIWWRFECGWILVLNIILTLFGYLPGVIHALYCLFYYHPMDETGDDYGSGTGSGMLANEEDVLDKDSVLGNGLDDHNAV